MASALWRQDTNVKELKTRIPVNSKERNVHRSETSPTRYVGLKRSAGRQLTPMSVSASPLMCDAVSL